VVPGRPAATGSTPVAPTASETPGRVTDPTVDTPRLLRRLTTALVLVGLLFGLAGALTFAGVALALDRAESNTAQLIRVQQIQTNLLSADATATNAFLVGGLEPTQQRATYDQAISTSTALIAEASDAQPADAAALTALNQDVVDYAVAVEQARANNRQGFPVGSQYLRNASAGLRTEALPILDQLVGANSHRAAAAMGNRIGLFFEILGLLSLAAMVLGMLWVARRFKRRINLGLVTASAVLLVVWVAGLLVLLSVGRTVDSIAAGSFDQVNSTAAARIQGYNAKSNESLTLIARGSGASFEAAWADAATDVDQRLAGLAQPAVTRAWQGYVATHRQIRKLDDGGSWDAAVKQATGGGATSSNARFGQFDTASSQTLDTVSRQTSDDLAASRPLLVVLAVLTFLAGLGAALLARWGIAARLKEYR
jgi:hypothetical protein